MDRLGARLLVLAMAAVLLAAMVSSAPAAPAQAEFADGVLIYGDRSDPESLDPSMGTGTSGYLQALLMYDTLLARNNSGQVVPLLATSWQMSPDGKAYTFRLRRDVEFHSGKKFTSADVKYTLERLGSEEAASPWQTLVASVDRVLTPDPYTVVVQLKAPNRLFLQNMSHAGASIMNQEAIRKYGKEFGRTAVDGTGPFRFVDRAFNDRIIYDRFEKYKWGPGFYQNRGPARISRVVWRVVPELATRQLMIERGEIDLITHNALPDVLYRRAELQGRVDITLRPVMEIRAVFLNANFSRLKERAVRRAIAHAVNAKVIAETIYAPVGEQAFNMLHPLAYGYWKGAEQGTPRYDLARARQTLEEAGWRLNPAGFREKGGVQLRGFRLTGLPQYAAIGVVLKESLAQIGIQVDVQMLERGRLYPMRRTGDVEIEITNTTGTPEVIHEYMHSSNFPGSNRFGWKDSRTDQLIETFLGGPDEKAALAAGYEVQKIALVDENLFVPIYVTSELNIVNSRTLRGFVGSTWQNAALGKLVDVWSNRRR
jgi:peptide/nickel transport system substrate-binding protein